MRGRCPGHCILWAMRKFVQGFCKHVSQLPMTFSGPGSRCLQLDRSCWSSVLFALQFLYLGLSGEAFCSRCVSLLVRLESLGPFVPDDLISKPSLSLSRFFFLSVMKGICVCFVDFIIHPGHWPISSPLPGLNFFYPDL